MVETVFWVSWYHLRTACWFFDSWSMAFWYAAVWYAVVWYAAVWYAAVWYWVEDWVEEKPWEW